MSYASAEVAFFRRPDNRRPGEKYGLAPKSYWGYKNWLDWEKHLNDIVMNEEDGKKKLLLYRDCFKWYVVLFVLMFACHAKCRDG